jgi:hypothetical protein
MEDKYSWEDIRLGGSLIYDPEVKMWIFEFSLGYA